MIEGYVGRSWVVWDGAMLNFALTEFSEVRLLRGMRRTEVAGIILIGGKGLTR